MPFKTGHYLVVGDVLKSVQNSRYLTALSRQRYKRCPGPQKNMLLIINTGYPKKRFEAGSIVFVPETSMRKMLLVAIDELRKNFMKFLIKTLKRIHLRVTIIL